MPARPLRLALQALALAGVVVGSVGFVSLDRAVVLVVDGERRTVHTYGEDVGDLLADEGLQVGERDLLVPGPDTVVADGTEVVVRYARKLTLTQDGQTRDYWTTALTVQEALDSLGIRADAVRLSVSRSQPLGRQGLSLDLTTRKRVVVTVDDRRLTATTYAPTVADVLRELSITLDEDDRTSVAADTEVTDGMLVHVARVEKRTITRTEKVPHPVTEKETDALPEGETKVETEGVDGVKRVTWLETWVDGERTSKRELRSEVTTEPVPEVVLVGTDTGPEPAADGLNWAALADCESGGNPKAVNPAGYYGLYQFSLPTWESVGGKGKPTDASADEQTYRAQLLYERVGRGAWPHCGQYL